MRMRINEQARKCVRAFDYNMRNRIFFAMVANESESKRSPMLERDTFIPGMAASLVRKLRKELQLTQAQLAKRLGVDQSTVSRWEAGAEPEGEQRRALALLLQELTPAPGHPVERRRVTQIPVVGAVQAGEWIEAVEWDSEERTSLWVPVDKRLPDVSRKAYEVRGTSMNLIYPPGSLVICVSTIDSGIHPKPGAHVLVQRRDRTGLYEVTIKEFIVDSSGRPWLWPRSSDPQFQAPIAIPTPDEHDDNDDVTLSGLVIASYRVE